MVSKLNMEVQCNSVNVFNAINFVRDNVYAHSYWRDGLMLFLKKKEREDYGNFRGIANCLDCRR